MHPKKKSLLIFIQTRNDQDILFVWMKHQFLKHLWRFWRLLIPVRNDGSERKLYAIWTEVLGHLIITPTGTLHSKYIDINMEFVPLCRYKLPLFWEGFPQDFGVFQLEFLPIHLVEQWCWTRKPGSQSPFQLIPKVFDGVEVRVLSGPVKFFHVKLIQLTMSLCTLLCALKHSHAGIETGLPQTVPTKLEAKHSLLKNPAYAG